MLLLPVTTNVMLSATATHLEKFQLIYLVCKVKVSDSKITCYKLTSDIDTAALERHTRTLTVLVTRATETLRADPHCAGAALRRKLQQEQLEGK